MRRVVVMIALALGVSALALVGAGAIALRLPRAEAPAEEQPLAFSHRVHAGDNRIDCLGCHTYAAHAPVAGVPSMARCIGCHRFVDRDKPAIRELKRAFDEGRVLRWTRVHRLPDHVFFTHERHVAAGVRCQECHGPVETMDRVRRVAPLTMGWCLGCHAERHAPVECITCHK